LSRYKVKTWISKPAFEFNSYRYYELSASAPAAAASGGGGGTATGTLIGTRTAAGESEAARASRHAEQAMALQRARWITALGKHARA
jgi:hypothetical protein